MGNCVFREESHWLAVLLLEPLYQIQPTDRITVIDHLNSQQVAGHFSGYPAGTILMSGETAYKVDYQGEQGTMLF